MQESGLNVVKSNNDIVWQKIYEWWKSFQPEKNKEKVAQDSADKEFRNTSGDRANLRRARNPDMVAMQCSYLNLYHAIAKEDISDYVKKRLGDRLPLVAGILSHVKENQEESVAIVMGKSPRQNPDGSALVSDLRFRRLMKTYDDDDSLYIMMIRMVRMMECKVNVKDMAESLFFWNDMTRKRWASRYYLHKDIYSDDKNK